MAESTSKRNTSPSAEPRKAAAQTSTPGDTTDLDALERQRQEKIQAQVDASPLDAAPEDQTGPTGGSFYNPAHVGSGTIMPNGTYGSPLPDPNVERLAKAHEEAKGRDAQ